MIQPFAQRVSHALRTRSSRRSYEPLSLLVLPAGDSTPPASAGRREHKRPARLRRRLAKGSTQRDTDVVGWMSEHERAEPTPCPTPQRSHLMGCDAAGPPCPCFRRTTVHDLERRCILDGEQQKVLEGRSRILDVYKLAREAPNVGGEEEPEPVKLLGVHCGWERWKRCVGQGGYGVCVWGGGQGGSNLQPPCCLPWLGARPSRAPQPSLQECRFTCSQVCRTLTKPCTN